jgi:ABC-type lipoprotein export system ATPase subunit
MVKVPGSKDNFARQVAFPSATCGTRGGEALAFSVKPGLRSQYPPMNPPLIRLRHVTREYGPPESRVRALDDLSLDIAAHDFVAITGPSGCGKSTLLHLLGGLDTPTAGELFIGDLPLHNAAEKALTAYRRRDLGIVFQFFNLLPTMNVLENVSLPLLLAGQPPSRVQPLALELLEMVGLANRATHFAHQLSGGEMQRTAIARALIHRPRLLLADEPTGNLDSVGAWRVIDVLRTVAAQAMTTLVIVTHSEEVANAAFRRICLRDGREVEAQAEGKIATGFPAQ